MKGKWSRLPHGCQLGRLYPALGARVERSGDDLRTYFCQLRNHKHSVPGSAFGRTFYGRELPGKDLEDDELYILALNVTAMGDVNAVDTAQATHIQI